MATKKSKVGVKDLKPAKGGSVKGGAKKKGG
jgi:hypothetical protein